MASVSRSWRRSQPSTHRTRETRTELDRTLLDEMDGRYRRRLADIEQALELILGRLDAADKVPPAPSQPSPQIMGLLDDMARRVRAVEDAAVQSMPSEDGRIPECERKVGAVDAHLRAVDEAIRRIIGDDGQRARAISAMQQGQDALRTDIGELIQRIAGLEMSVGSSDGLSSGEEAIDLPRMFGGGAQRPQVAPGVGSISGRVASIEDRIEDVGKRIDAMVGRFGGYDKQIGAIVERLREPEPEPVPERTVQDARLEAITEIKAAGVARRRAPIQTADAGVVEGRLFEVAINAKSFGRADALDALAAMVGNETEINDVASDIIASHDMLLLLTARTVALERQATSAITRPELDTIAAVEAERDRWIGRINAATGIGDGTVDGG